MHIYDRHKLKLAANLRIVVIVSESVSLLVLLVVDDVAFVACKLFYIYLAALSH